MARKEGGWVHPKAGTEIGTVECETCGSETALKINKNGCAYAWCRKRDDEGRQCYWRVSYGQQASAEMISEYEGHNGEAESDNQAGGEPSASGGNTSASENGSDGDADSGTEANSEDRDEGGKLFGGFFG